MININEEDAFDEIASELNRLLVRTADIKFKEKVLTAIKESNEAGAFITQEELFTILLDTKKIAVLEQRVQKVCKLLIIINQVDAKAIDPAKYFTQREINDNRIFILNPEDNLRYYHLKNVQQKTDAQFSLLLSVGDIARMSLKNIVEVDPEFQRQSVLSKDVYGETIRKVKINPKRVEAIAEAISTHRYWYDEIRFAIVNEQGVDAPIFDADKNTLDWNGKCLVTDGNHRVQACVKAYVDHPEMRDEFDDMKFAVSIVYASPVELKESLVQIWNMEPITMEQKRVLQSDKVIDKIVVKIKYNPEANRLYTSGIASGTSTVMNRAFLTDSIEEFFDVGTRLTSNDIMEISGYLTEFFNIVVDIYKNEYTDYFASRKNGCWITTRCGVYVLVYIASRLYNVDNWQDKAQRALTAMNFIDNEITKTMIRQQNIFKPMRKRVINEADVILAGVVNA